MRDFSLTERDIALMNTISVTRNAAGDPTQIVRQTTTPEGDTVTVTDDITYDANEDVQGVTRTFTGAGASKTKTLTITRDGNTDISQMSWA